MDSRVCPSKLANDGAKISEVIVETLLVLNFAMLAGQYFSWFNFEI